MVSRVFRDVAVVISVIVLNIFAHGNSHHDPHTHIHTNYCQNAERVRTSDIHGIII
ncbi:MAG: hypothetical protein ISR65_08955 [Bacteriovoracaceae bacterium]|nr:hypothetical protein [Bacteriovoracaceae bacterium]